jgi:EAL and modified HD-GYP domain-containing signal transduction protein
MITSTAGEETAPLTTEQVLLGRQPIVDRDGRMYAFELLFRAERQPNAARYSDDVLATSHVLRHVFAELGVEKALGPYRGFVNCDVRMLLMPETLDVLPSDRVVIEILESVEPTAEVLERLRELKSAGFAIALDDYRGPRKDYDPLLALADFVKIDLPRIKPAALDGVIEGLRGLTARLVAEKVQTRAQAERCRAAGIDFFQGFFFARPVIVEGRKLGLPQIALLRLLNLLLQDADTSVVVEEFKKHPGLSLNLLRIANSAAATRAARVHSIAQAIVLVGRRQLRRWVQLLLYTDAAPAGASNPLLQLAATRGRLMESVAETLWPSATDRADLAFMVGILSLMPAVFGVSFEDILPSLPLPEEARAALLGREGVLGDLLVRIQALELDPMDDSALPDGLSADVFSRELVGAMSWANRIG